MATRKEVLCRVAGATSGLLMSVGQIYSPAAILQAVALIPILYFGADKKIRLRIMLTSGMYMGIVYTLPQIAMLRLPIPITVILLLELTATMTAFAGVSAVLLRRSPIAGSIAVGAAFVVLDWANYTFVPIWGTAQSLVRCWSSYPNLIQFVSLAGTSAVSFTLGSLQSLIVNFVIRAKIRTRILITALVEIAILFSVNIACVLPNVSNSIKVAAIGWCNEDLAEYDIQKTEGFNKFFAEPVSSAAKKGAKLIVSGEMGFYIDQYDRSKWLRRFSKVARDNRVHLAIGYLNAGENKNRLMFIDPEGEILCEYTKTYLTLFENSNKGNGDLRMINIDGINVGGMICQDDNFTELSRKYGRMPVSVTALPTLDWATVKNAHLQNSIHRAIESRYAVVRAAVNGISAVISPTGEVLTQMDHFQDGPGVITAEVPVYRIQTMFSKLGNWPVGLSAIFLVLFAKQNFCNKDRFSNSNKNKAA
jgi:apolipoprotein N-acyltransferase